MSVTTPSPVPENIKVEGNWIKIVAPKTDTKTGKAKGAPIRQEDLNKALEHVKANSSKIKTIMVDIPKEDGAHSYAVELPEAALTCSACQHQDRD
ncbi:hypothetical protein Q0F98_39205 [Paenibacillus amylolyticus]|nr:hypothetical protein Q0F98_39205 [Paenibacillus amylolyticus]